MPLQRPLEPWNSYLTDLDAILDRQVVVHCIGGFAVAMLYGFQRPTVDADCVSVIPAAETATLPSLAGEGSALRRLLLFGLEAHDLALSKLERNSARDREDIRFLARTAPLDLIVLESRYRSELRPYLTNTDRHDLTMRLWLEMLSGA